MSTQDPVCGMGPDPQGAFATREHMGSTIYFCSQSCADQFDRDPHRYVMTSATTGVNSPFALTRIELPTSTSTSGTKGNLESSLRLLPGVEAVQVGSTADRVETQYDSATVVSNANQQLPRSAARQSTSVPSQ